MLQIRALQKSYVLRGAASRSVINIQALDVAQGAQIAIGGPSGSGKSTLLHLIAGLLPADSGSILIDGLEMVGTGERQRDRLRAEKVGIVFQTSNLLQSCTALENVLLGGLFGRQLTRSAAVDLLERVGLSDCLAQRPGELSVGQQQRVAVARALAGSPPLVLADEPTASLDDAAAVSTLTLLSELCRSVGSTLLAVSHDARLLSRFDGVIDLKDINGMPSKELRP